MKGMFFTAMRELHLKEGVLTGEECMKVYTSISASGVLSDSTLALILATKSKEQCELATEILKSSSVWCLHRRLSRRYIHMQHAM